MLSLAWALGCSQDEIVVIGHGLGLGLEGQVLDPDLGAQVLVNSPAHPCTKMLKLL